MIVLLFTVVLHPKDAPRGGHGRRQLDAPCSCTEIAALHNIFAPHLSALNLCPNLIANHLDERSV